MYRSVFVLFVALTGCGQLEPSAPDSKLNNAGSNNGGPNSSGGNNGGSTAGQTNTSVDAGLWGTEGPATKTGKSADGNAFCTLDDITTADLSGRNDSEVPAGPWESSPVADAAGRCGDDLETQIWRLHNCERIGRGLEPYSCDLRLVWTAREHTLDMVRQDYFRHDNPAGESPFDRLDRHRVGWMGAAENIAGGQDALNLHYSWMDSTGHRDNILGNYSHCGLGVEPDGNGMLGTAVFINAR